MRQPSLDPTLATRMTARSTPSGLFTAVISTPGRRLIDQTLVAPLTKTEVSSLHQRILDILADPGPPVMVDIRCIHSETAVAYLEVLRGMRGLELNVSFVDSSPVGKPPFSHGTREQNQTCNAFQQSRANSFTDPFGLRVDLRGWCMAITRICCGAQRVLQIRGRDFLPRSGPVLLAAVTEAGLCNTAILISAAFDIAHADRRCLRVLYDKNTADLPGLAPLFNALGGVPASFANAKLLLTSGEAVCLLGQLDRSRAQGSRRYQRLDLGTGPARLSWLTGSPIVPVVVKRRATGRQYTAPPAELRKAPWAEDLLKNFTGLSVRLAQILRPCLLEIHFLPPIPPPPPQGQSAEQAIAQIDARLRQAIVSATA